MASFIFFLVAEVLLVLLFSCFAPVCLSYTFVDDNPIRMKSQALRYYGDDHGFLDDDYSSFANIIMRPPIEAIYQFGDSVSNTGNIPTSTCGKFPYGVSYFDKPTGRCSDGLLIIDHIATFAGLPFLDAYLNKEGNFSHGVNFAVEAATALDVTYLSDKYNVSAGSPFSLPVQLAWFKSYLNSTFSNVSDCKKKLSNALIIIGEVGGNDYNKAFWQGKKLPEIYRMVPDVVLSATDEIINLGATRIAIPGNFPIGCTPIYLAHCKTDDTTKYDELKCLKYLNDFMRFHNDQLQLAIIDLQIRYPNVAIVYIDYYGAMRDVLKNADSLGYDTEALYKTCCGQGENEYNFDRFCGDDGVPYCKDPQKRISWDGIHPTQRTYYLIVKRLLRDAIPDTVSYKTS